MNSKFYVSLEAARLLKEKGYNKEVEMFYNDIGVLREVREFFQDWECLSNDRLYNNRLSAPSKAEAIDWLDEKGIIIELSVTHDLCHWVFSIYMKGEETILHDADFDFEYLQTRLGAEEAAIIKALELL